MSSSEDDSNGVDRPFADSAEAERRGVGGRPYFLVEIASVHLAITAHSVESVVPAEPATKIPCTPGHVLGLIPYGDGTLAIFDPASFLQLSQASDADKDERETTRFVVVKGSGMQVGLRCDRAAGVITIDPTEIRPATVLTGGRLSEFVTAEFDTTEQRIGILDIDGLIDAARVRGAAASDGV